MKRIQLLKSSLNPQRRCRRFPIFIYRTYSPLKGKDSAVIALLALCNYFCSKFHCKVPRKVEIALLGLRVDIVSFNHDTSSMTEKVQKKPLTRGSLIDKACAVTSERWVLGIPLRRSILTA